MLTYRDLLTTHLSYKDFFEARRIKIEAPMAQDGTVEMYLTSDFDIIHVPERKIYKRDRSIALENLTYTEIPGLSPVGEPVSLMVLLATLFKPLGIPSSYYAVNHAYCPKAAVENVEFRHDPAKLIWLFPKGGIPLEDNPDLLYIPGVKDTLVSKAGDIIDATTKMPVVLSRYDKAYEVKLAHVENMTATLTQEELVALAKGYYDLSGINFIEFRKDINGSDIEMPVFATFEEVTGHTK